MNYFCHEKSLVETKNVGENSRIWAFAHILPGAIIGKNANICDGVFIENDVQIGKNVTIKCGVQVWDGIKIEDDVFIGPNATFTNDPYPKSKQFLKEYPRTHVKSHASIGANSTILPGLTINENAMIGAGAVLTKDAPPHSIIIGNPGRAKSYGYDSISNDIKRRDEHFDLSENIKSIKNISDSSRDYNFCYKNASVEILTKNDVDIYTDNGKKRILHKMNKENNYLKVPPKTWMSFVIQESSSASLFFGLKRSQVEPLTAYTDFLSIVRRS